jgi:dipeptidyl aminopeptidase/acylaminoacyl peptidase
MAHRLLNPMRFVARVLMAISMAAGAAAKEMPEGPLPDLTGDLGYLLVVIDTDRPLPLLRLNRQGSILGTQDLEDLPQGISVRVLRVPAGRYRWQRVAAGGHFVIEHDPDRSAIEFLALLQTPRFDISDSEALMTLEVQAGKFNYAGELRLRFRDRMLSLSMPNRLEQGLRDVRTRHPLPAIPTVHAGQGLVDPWIDRRIQVLDRRPGLAPETCPATSTLPTGEPTVAELYRSEEILDLSMSPDGRLVSETAYRKGQFHVAVIEPETGDIVPLYTGDAEVVDVAWVGPRRIVVGQKGNGLGNRNVAFHIPEGPLRNQRPTAVRFPVDGEIVDRVSGRVDALFYAVVRPDHSDPLQIFLVDLAKGPLKKSDFRPHKRIDPKLENDRAWMADSRGRLNVALVADDESVSIVRRSTDDEPFETLMLLDGERMLWPVSIDDDGSVLALTNEGRQQTELVRIKPDRPGMMETVHAQPGTDIDHVLFDGDGRTAVGVSYYVSGKPTSVFFDAQVRNWSDKLAEAFPDRHPELVHVDRQHGRAIVSVSGDTSPPEYFLFDQRSEQSIPLGSGAPWLSKTRFVPRTVVDLAMEGERNLQALLALPEGAGPHPLLVMPHGGPFFVQDVLRFNRDVQYWATRGFAVLQVNFRGSYGFGVDHLLDGFGGFGRQIEDDIEAAVDAVLGKEASLDPARVCAVGGSYGGYSAMMLGLRDPDRFKCIVAMAAPSDLPLLFTSSDWSRSDTARRAMARAIGQPTDPELVQLSPAYNAGRISVPTLLIHGEDDRRVDIEHSTRLAVALDPADGHRFLRIEGMGHGADLVDQHACMMGVAELFVREKLRSSPTTPSSGHPSN